MRISIVTPSFNQARFLPETLASVRAQRLEGVQIEHIVIDGGSADGSVDIIQAHEEEIAYWVSEPDGGQSAAINKGFRRATGEIVAWINSDDLYLPGAAELAAKRFSANPRLGLLYGNCVYIDEASQFLRYFDEVEPFDANRLLNCGNYIMQPTTFIRRKLLVELNYLDEQLHYTMDWDLWCRIAKSGWDVHYEREILAANREYGDTKTLAGGWPRLLEITRLQQRHRTAVWPQALFGFASVEFQQTASRRKGLSRFGWRLASKIARRGTLWGWQKGDLRRVPIQGVHADTQLLEPDAAILIPAYREVSRLTVKLIPQGKGDVRLTINGVEVGNYALGPAGEIYRIQTEIPASAMGFGQLVVGIHSTNAAVRLATCQAN